MADEQVPSLNAARVVMVGHMANEFVHHLEHKIALHTDVFLYRAAWANADQLISGAEIVDPLHPAALRARLTRLVAMACAGQACCGRDEAEYWTSAAARLCAPGDAVLLGLTLARLVSSAQVDVDWSPEAAAAPLVAQLNATEVSSPLRELWLGPRGLVERIASARNAFRSEQRSLPPVIHDRSLHRRSRRFVSAFDYLRVGIFRLHQRWEIREISRTAQLAEQPHRDLWRNLDTKPTAFRMFARPSLHPHRCHHCGRRRRIRVDAHPRWFVY